MNLTWIKNNRLGLLIIGLTWLIFFSRTIFLRQVYFLDDLKIIYLPLEHAYALSQSHWQLPVWSNLFGFGQPLIAWGQLGFFTPVHLLLRLLNIAPLILLQISILTYYALGLLGFFIFLRRLKTSQLAAALGSVVFVFSGFHVGHLNHVNFYTSTMLLPWLLLTVHLFLQKPTLTKTGLLALLAATGALSGQPQITLYTLLVAALYGAILYLYQAINLHRLLLKPIILSGLALLLFFGLASFAVLPLQEFLPHTERSSGIDPYQLYEFSYPPWHAITLIIPYFYGNHDNYFGAKGFQELAAFTGLIPLLLAAATLTNWRHHRPQKIFAILLIAITIAIALGRHSFIYTFLVENFIIRSLSVPGRFVYFFDIGIAFLAAFGLDSLLKNNSFKKRLAPITLSLLLTLGLLTPFLNRLQASPLEYKRLLQLNQLPLQTWALPVLGFIAFIASGFISRPRLSKTILTSLTAITLIAHGWNYNPLTLLADTRVSANLTKTLADADARLYSRPSIHSSLQVQPTQPTDPISPEFYIYQPLIFPPHATGCLEFPIHVQDSNNQTPLTVSLHQEIAQPPITSVSIIPSDIIKSNHTICFPPAVVKTNQTTYVSFTATGTSSLNLLYSTFAASPDRQAYFIRVANPNSEQLKRSLKPAQVVISTPTTEIYDDEAATLARHLNVLANASSARWIGALSIRPYREFIETFFANDRDDLIDGESVHIFARHRRLLNLVGVTHLIQIITADNTDLLPDLGFTAKKDIPINNQKTVRLYHNDQAWPKAFLVNQAEFIPAADDIRARLTDPNFNPREIALVSGDKPPPELPSITTPEAYSGQNVTITNYQNTLVQAEVTSQEPTWLVITDSSLPQWQTFIDDEPAPYYTAYSFLKAAYVPAGTHQISFRYNSPAIHQAKILTLIALPLTLLLIFWQQLRVLIQRLLRRGQKISPANS